MDDTTDGTQGNGSWTVDDDLSVFRRVKKILDTVPAHAWHRVAAYLGHVLFERAGTGPYLRTRSDTNASAPYEVPR